MKHSVSKPADQTRPAEGVALSFMLPELPQKAAWYGLLHSFPYLRANRQAGHPVPGSESARAQEDAMSWSGPRGVGWPVEPPTGPMHAPGGGKDVPASQGPVSREAVSAESGQSLQPMVPALGLMLNTQGGRGSIIKKASAMAPGLHNLLEGAFRPLAGRKHVTSEGDQPNRQTASEDSQGRQQAQAWNTEPPTGGPLRDKQAAGRHDALAQRVLTDAKRGSIEKTTDDSKPIADIGKSQTEGLRDAAPGHTAAPSATQRDASRQVPISIPTQGSIVQRMTALLASNRAKQEKADSASPSVSSPTKSAESGNGQTPLAERAEPVAEKAPSMQTPTSLPVQTSIVQGLAKMLSERRSTERPVSSGQDNAHALPSRHESKPASPPFPDQGSVVQRMTALLASNRAKQEKADSASPSVSSPTRSAESGNGQTPLAERAEPVAEKAPSMQTPTPLPVQTSIVQGLAKMLSERRSTERPVSGAQDNAHALSIPVNRITSPTENGTSSRASSTTDTGLNATMPTLSVGGLNTLRALMPAALAAGNVRTGVTNIEAQPERAVSVHEALAHAAGTNLHELSRGNALAAPLVQRRGRTQGGAEMQVLTQLFERLEGRVQENVRRLVEQRLEQQAASAEQARAPAQAPDKSPRENIDQTMIISDEVVQALMNKIHELSEEARFRSGRLR